MDDYDYYCSIPIHIPIHWSGGKVYPNDSVRLQIWNELIYMKFKFSIRLNDFAFPLKLPTHIQKCVDFDFVYGSWIVDRAWIV